MARESVTRATTPTHYFTITTDPSQFKRLLITYKQGGNIVLEKEKGEIHIEVQTEEEETVYVLSYRLTQEETKLFDMSAPVKIQIRALTYDGAAPASDIVCVDVEDVLNDEVLV